MNKISLKATEIKEYLLSLDEVKEYLTLKKEYENNKSLILLKRDIVRAKNENRLDDYKILKEKFDNHPIVINYFASKEIIKELLKGITDIINL